METEASVASSSRPRSIILVLLGVVAAALLVMRFTGSTAPDPAASNQPRAPQQQPQAGEGPVDPSTLDVRLESLDGERPAPGESERNPFRFQPKAPPPEPPRPRTESKPRPEVEMPTGPAPPPPPPPITVKFLGTMDLPNGTVVAVLTDCSVGHRTTHAREGQTVLGQYRLVKIGLTSVVIEHLDGRGRTTLAKDGQECVWK
jgi:hypothetical protein